LEKEVAAVNRPWALVTGASSGIGQGIAIRLAKDGFNIAINHFRQPELAEETLQSIQDLGGDGWCFDADVGVSSEVSAMFRQFIDRDIFLSVLVNNAGIQTWASFLELAEEDWDRTIKTNLKGTFLCTQQAARLMILNGSGSIINIGSGANRVPFPNLVDYCASKGGIEMVTRVAAIELGKHGIRVNCVAPGAIENERTRRESPGYAETWSGVTPMARCGTIDDVANAVSYLASPQSPFITGQTLFVDGGLWTRGVWPYE
jgi:NAD(P)-dependent dehydrogenase (short-subunit alcohol dehydrogenase family)